METIRKLLRKLFVWVGCFALFIAFVSFMLWTSPNSGHHVHHPTDFAPAHHRR
jgi:hypothetical protein